MSADESKITPESSKAEAKKKRLAEALRANMKRRKQQSRGRIDKSDHNLADRSGGNSQGDQ